MNPASTDQVDKANKKDQQFTRMDFNTDWLLAELELASDLSKSAVASLASLSRFVGDLLSLADTYDGLGRLAQKEIRDQLGGHLNYEFSFDDSAISKSNIEFVADLLEQADQLIGRKLFHDLLDHDVASAWFSEIIELEAVLRGKLQRQASVHVERAEFASLAILLKLVELGGKKIRLMRENPSLVTPKWVCSMNPQAELTDLLALIGSRFSAKTPKRLALQALSFINSFVPILKHQATRQAIGDELTGFMLEEFRKLCLGRIFELMVLLKWDQDDQLRAQINRLACGLCNRSFHGKLRANLWEHEHKHEHLALGFAMLHAILEDGLHSDGLFHLVETFMTDPDHVHFCEVLKILHSLIRFKKLDEIEVLKALAMPFSQAPIGDEFRPGFVSKIKYDIQILLCKSYPEKFSTSPAGSNSSYNELAFNPMDEKSITSALVASRLGLPTSFLQENLFDSRWFWSLFIAENIKLCEAGQTSALLIRKLFELIDIALDVGVDMMRDRGRVGALVEPILAHCERSQGGAIDGTMYSLLKLVRSNLDDEPDASIWPLYHSVFGHVNPKTIVGTFEAIALAIEANRKAFLKSQMVQRRIISLIDLSSSLELDYKQASARFRLIEVLLINFESLSQDLVPILANLTNPILVDGEDTKEALDCERACLGANFAAMIIDLEQFQCVYQDNHIELATGQQQDGLLERARNFLCLKPKSNLFHRFMELWTTGGLDKQFNIFHQRLRLLALSRILTMSPEKRPPVVEENADKFLPIMLSWLESMKEEYENKKVRFSWSCIYDLRQLASAEGDQPGAQLEAKLEELKSLAILEYSPSLFKNLGNELEALQRALAHCRSEDPDWYKHLTKSLNDGEQTIVTVISDFGTKICRQQRTRKGKPKWRPYAQNSRGGRRK